MSLGRNTTLKLGLHNLKKKTKSINNMNYISYIYI